MFAARGARSGPILTYDYPGAICLCVDDEVVHGIPGDRTLEDGQLLSIDVAAELDGYHAEGAVTVPIGQPDVAACRLMAGARSTAVAAPTKSTRSWSPRAARSSSPTATPDPATRGGPLPRR